jgi:hypothetical protein
LQGREVVVAIPQALETARSLPVAAERSVPEARTNRLYLVFVRAGWQSLHRRLILEDPGRNWDCCVSWYVPPGKERLAEYYCGGGPDFHNKLEGFLEFWRRRPRPWRYRYVMLLDDDVYLRPGELSRFFELCDQHQLYLAQPALQWLTNTTLNALVRNPVCTLRRVSFVEVMAPCFSTPALADLLHTFRWTKSTWGVDWAWACLLEGREPLYVVDAVTMEHTRTGDGRPTAFYRQLQSDGVDPGAELHRIKEIFPTFTGSRTLARGHVFRAGMRPELARVLMVVFERLKFLVRLRKKLLRNLRACRVRLEDFFRDRLMD